jgi:transcriptional regulator with XRE-family HTH domain
MVRKAPSPARPAALAARLTELRRKSKRSAACVARAAGISRQHLWRIETGMVPNPSPDVLARVAKAYGIGLAQLLGRAPTRGREGTLLRLAEAAAALSDEEWRILDALANRVSAVATSAPSASRAA